VGFFVARKQQITIACVVFDIHQRAPHLKHIKSIHRI